MAMTNAERSKISHAEARAAIEILKKKYEKTSPSKLIERIYYLQNIADEKQANSDMMRKTLVKYQRLLSLISEAVTQVCDFGNVDGRIDPFRRDIALNQKGEQEEMNARDLSPTRIRNIFEAVRTSETVSRTMKTDLYIILGELLDRRHNSKLNKDRFTSRYGAESYWLENAKYLDKTNGFMIDGERYASIVDWLYAEKADDPKEAKADEDYEGELKNARIRYQNSEDRCRDLSLYYGKVMKALREAAKIEGNVCTPNGGKPIREFIEDIINKADTRTKEDIEKWLQNQ